MSAHNKQEVKTQNRSSHSLVYRGLFLRHQNGAADNSIRFKLRTGPDDMQKLQSRTSFEDAAPQAHENVQA